MGAIAPYEIEILNSTDIDVAATTTDDLISLPQVEPGDLMVGVTINVASLGGAANYSFNIRKGSPADTVANNWTVPRTTQTTGSNSDFGVLSLLTETGNNRTYLFSEGNVATENLLFKGFGGFPVFANMHARFFFNTTPTDASAQVYLMMVRWFG